MGSGASAKSRTMPVVIAGIEKGGFTLQARSSYCKALARLKGGYITGHVFGKVEKKSTLWVVTLHFSTSSLKRRIQDVTRSRLYNSSPFLIQTFKGVLWHINHKLHHGSFNFVTIILCCIHPFEFSFAPMDILGTAK